MFDESCDRIIFVYLLSDNMFQFYQNNNMLLFNMLKVHT
jgi:hypothetical protein